MSTPDHKLDRFSYSRRNNSNNSNTLNYESPFRRARLDSRSAGDNGADPSRVPSPGATKNGHGVRPRRSFGQTRTLRGAFEAAARGTTATGAAMSTDDSQRPPSAAAAIERRTPSPSRARRQRNMSVHSVASPVSPPPGELIETYRRINDADNLNDHVAQDEFDDPSHEQQQQQLRVDRTQRTSPGLGTRAYHEDAEDAYDSDLSFLDDGSDDSLRKKLANHVKDQQRLKRISSRESPVFSRAKVGQRALSAESLQRRERDEEEEQPPQQTHNSNDNDDDVEPALNLPRTWGRWKAHRERLNSITRRKSVSAPRDDAPQGNNNSNNNNNAPAPEWDADADIDFTARSLQVSDSPPVRKLVETRAGAERNLTRNHNNNNNTLAEDKSEDTQRRISRDKAPSPVKRKSVPNSPVSVYKAPSRDKPSPAKSDSHELLRKLARAESPKQVMTPEPKPYEKRLLEMKTPVVTGAWVDTPMTERVAEPPTPESLKDVPSPSKPPPPPPPKSEDTSAKPPEKPSEPREQKRPDSKEQKPSDQKQQEPSDSKDQKPSEPQEQPEPEVKREKRKLQLIKPQLPKSALETILADAKADNPLVLGDDTIASLQGILDDEPTLFKAEENEEREIKAAPAANKNNSTRAIAPGLDELKELTGKDTAILDQLNDKLQSLVQIIHDARNGLSSLEDQVARDTVIFAAAQQKRHSGGTCETCERCGDGRHYVAIPLPRLWRRDPVSQRIRPTRLGWFTALFLIWYVSESVMCEFYCHPFVAEVCERNCLMPDAPRFPFALPTMLWRWSHLSAIISPLLTILTAFLRLLAQLLGLWDGYVDDAPQEWFFGDVGVRARVREFPVVATPAAEVHSGGDFWSGQAASSRVNDGLSMDDDEYI